MAFRFRGFLKRLKGCPHRHHRRLTSSTSYTATCEKGMASEEALAYSTSIAFPTTDGAATSSIPQVPSSPQRRQHLLSFRRISLPTPPALLNRQSSASLQSFDSFPEEGVHATPIPKPGALKNGTRKALQRPFSLDMSKRPQRRRDSIKPADDTKSVRRRKIVAEFYDTERAYVEGLDLIYSHFLTPIIASLDTSTPLLDRDDLIVVFSNFIDIWNLHRSFYTSLSELLQQSLSNPQSQPPPISPVLISHFPYLSLYTPFITTFPTVLSRLATLSATSSTFDTFIKTQEADSRCGKLKLRDWLLTIVQRCPRYLLLLKDLITCTDPEDPEHASLVAAHSLLSKVTSSLDTSLHTHSQTLALLALQRATPNLPMQLISPGRSLLRRGSLFQLDHSSDLKERDFILFNDCIIWLAKEGVNDVEWLHSKDLGIGLLLKSGGGKRLQFNRSRSKSENELPTLAREPSSPKRVAKSAYSEDRWSFKGKVDLVDVDVIVSPVRESGDETRFEILCPEVSFAVYAESEQDRDDWASAIRAAKASLLVSLNVMHPQSTLATSVATNHLRRSLQAIPYLPEEIDNDEMPKRGKVDHFIPAIWVPDGKTDSCMRCGRVFNWRRRRHHCRLCGRCVCGTCSGRTFFISEASSKTNTKPARACNACYDTVFPILESSSSEGTVKPTQSGSTLSSFPSWTTQKPSSPAALRPSFLMDLDSPSRLSSSPEKHGRRESPKRVDVIRRSSARPISHLGIPEAFQEAPGDSPSSADASSWADGRDGKLGASRLSPLEHEADEDEDVFLDRGSSSKSENVLSERLSNERESSPVFEVSQGQRKRFSMPAIALQTTQVTARPNVMGEGPSKRFSLVLGGKYKAPAHVQTHDSAGQIVSSGEMEHGIAAAKLIELLGRERGKISER